MDNKEATRTCGQCHKEVAEANFALHETHCSRFLCICPDCDEAVPREQLDQHREEQHTQVKCSKCNQKMERCHLMDHESDECVERLQSCQYCELELPWKELAGHSLVCGSRTELCRDCNRYVTLKDQAEHRLTCSDADSGSGPSQTASSSPNKTKITVNCSSCMASFPAEDIEEHELECFTSSRWDYEEAEPKEKETEDEDDFSRQGAASQLSSTYKATSLSFRPRNGPMRDGSDPHQISTCPHCHLALPLITLRWHKEKCQIYILLK
ncbi:XIAP-associated factor 1 [Thunnus albacares]|uniref:XIAP-associated factor 1 n=1 Tax=Thunnus albacares TaxID=8236 RepID=UPI001CF6BF08|nr:XIAP-associated factor 1 [Thunnus albacares]